MTATCPACKSSDVILFVSHPQDREYFVKRTVSAQILRCKTCLSLFQDPLPTAEETSTFYGPSYQQYAKSSIPFLSEIYTRTQNLAAEKFVRTHGKDQKVLDFGCGHGFFLSALHRVGCTRLYGFDFVPQNLDELSGVTQYFDTLISLANCGLQFDIIRMNHVIEHLVDLDQTMVLLRRLLSPNGQIIGQTPNAAHYTSDFFKSWWGPLHYPYHTILLSPKSLQAAHKRWGFQSVSIFKSLMPTAWAMTFENWCKACSGSHQTGRTPIYSLLLMCSIPFILLDKFVPFLSTGIMDYTLKITADKSLSRGKK